MLVGRLAPTGDGENSVGSGQAQAAEAFGDLGGPPPGAVDAQAGAAGGAGELGGHVQHPVADGGDLAAGQRGHGGEADQLGPADQVGGGQHGGWRVGSA